jgi:polysaccharide export outer membrane protein
MLPVQQRNVMAKVLCALAILVFSTPASAGGLFGFGKKNEAPTEEEAAASVAEVPPQNLQTAYRLGTGDKVRITVFNEKDLTGEFEVNSTGAISFPLVGDIPAQGKTLVELQKAIETTLSDGYLINPKVSIDVISFRPFFIVGEVNKPGSYPYVNALTVLNAVALAGGFTYRAKEDEVVIRRVVNGKTVKFEADEAVEVLPGDVIRVKERLF